MNLSVIYNQIAVSPILIGLFVCVLMIWSFVWKGIALWRAAQSGDKRWFVVLLLVNSLGILEIIYIYAVLPRRKL